MLVVFLMSTMPGISWFICRRILTTRTCPCAHAVKKGVIPRMSGVIGFAPASSRNVTISMSPFAQLKLRGVTPSSAPRFTLCPLSSSSVATLTLLFFTAQYIADLGRGALAGGAQG